MELGIFDTPSANKHSWKIGLAQQVYFVSGFAREVICYEEDNSVVSRSGDLSQPAASPIALSLFHLFSEDQTSESLRASIFGEGGL